MANLGGSDEEAFCVFVESNFDTRLAHLLHKSDTVSLFKDNFCKEHTQAFPEFGEIRVSAVKVKRGNHLYHIPDSVMLSKVLKGIRFIDVDVVKGDLLTLKVVSRNVLPEGGGKEIASCSNLSLDETNRNKTRKKRFKGLDDMDKSHELCGTVASESCHVQKVDDLKRAQGQDLENGEEAAGLVKIDQEKAVENCGGDLASKVEDSGNERKNVQHVENNKGHDDQYASRARGVEIKTKKSKKRKQSCEDLKTDNKDEENDDVSVPRNEEDSEFNGGKLETCLPSSVITHKNVAEGVSSLETRVLPTCSCQGQKARKLVVFDLNGIFADILHDYKGPFVPDGRISNRAVFRRPFVASFLDFCFERFDVGIWSSRRIGLDYMTNIVMGKHVRNLLFSFDQHSCTTTKFNTLEKSSKPLFLKDLKKVWNRFSSCFNCGKQKYDETNTLLVDDSPHKALCNPPYTGIFPLPYQYTDRGDDALGPNGELRKYMERLADAENIQKFVQENPFGQSAINERHESWEFYSKVFEAYK